MSEFIPVSVIIPCYRCADVIERAIDSVNNQTLKPLEVILIEDYSDDQNATKNKILSLIKRTKYPVNWLKVIFLDKNVGPGVARNEGWKIADGDYIAFLDADDSWHPQKLQIQYSIMSKNHEIDFTCHNTAIKDNQDKDVSETFRDVEYKIKKITLKRMLLSNIVATRTVMLKKKLPYSFNANKRYSEDYQLWLEIIGNNNKSIYIYETLAYSYKQPFGESGLSSRLWEMQKGEVDSLISLNKLGLINKLILIPCLLISYLKFFRRYLLSSLSKYFGGGISS